MAEFYVEIGQDIPHFLEFFGQVKDSKSAFSYLRGVMNALAMQYLSLWQSYAQGVPIPPYGDTIHSRSGGYYNSIKADMTKDWEKVIYSDSPIHRYIEDGHGPIDLKPGLLSGPKARTGKHGNYNIVSFRHGTPGTLGSNKPMPQNVYNYLLSQTKKAENEKRLGFSRIAARTKRTRQNPGGRVGAYGVRTPSHLGGEPMTKHVVLPTGARKKETIEGTYTWKTGKYTGMVRMKDVLTRGASPQYRTFRVVSTKSDPFSWVVPARAPLPIRQAVVDTMRPIVERAIKDAMEKDFSI